MELHLRFVFFEVGEALLQINVLLPLRSHGLVVEFGIMLDHRHNVLEVVIVQSFEVALHAANLRPVRLYLFLVVFQLHLGILQVVLQLLHIAFHV